MHRCFISPESWNEPEVKPAPCELHHLLHVMRARNGDRVGVFDGCGGDGSAEVVVRGEDDVVLKILARQEAGLEMARIVLIQAVPKGRRMDLVVEKATELGACSIWPVITERVVMRLNERKRLERAERWRRVALSAVRQSGGARVPDILPVADYAEALARAASFDLLLIAALDPRAANLRSVLDAGRGAVPRGRGPGIALLVGPEGDFTPGEVTAAVRAGARVVDFGGRVLRSETAALYGLSVLAYEFGAGRSP